VKSFFDCRNRYLGSRTETESSIIYKDKWKRVIKVFPKFTYQTINQLKKDKKVRNLNSNLRNANRIEVKGNKVNFYNGNGILERTAKRRGKKKVYFHNSLGKLIGYKIYKYNGTTIYKDSRGRITGKSFTNRNGRMIYRPKNRKRMTNRVLFDDPFLFN
jgi:hypothetical protein